MRVYLANTASSWLSWRLAYIRTSKGTGKCPYLSLPKILACRTIEVKRLNGLIRTLKRKPQMAKDYMECMEKIITKGHASPVPIGEVTRPLQSGRVWHLPHFRVYHMKKPTQISCFRLFSQVRRCVFERRAAIGSRSHEQPVRSSFSI